MHGIEAPCQITSFDPDLSFSAETNTALFRFGEVRTTSSHFFQV